MRFTLGQLEAFYWVARLGTFQAAAQHLHMSQPTVSIRVRQLETALETSLFERSSRSVRPTLDGAKLISHAERLLGIATEIQKLNSLLPSERVLLRVGAPEMFALACLPDLTNRLLRDHPELKLEMTIANSVELMGLLREREIDLAFITNPDPDRRLRAEPMGDHEMAWVASSTLELPEVVRPTDLMRFQIICNPHPSVMFRTLMDWFRSRGLEPVQIHTCNSPTVIARLAAAGVGLSLLPPSIISAELASGALRALKARPKIPSVTLFATYHSADESPSVRTVIEVARQVLGTSALLSTFPHGPAADRR